MTRDKHVTGWLSLDLAAETMKCDLARIRGQITNGRLSRDLHFRRVQGGRLELNVEEYLSWLQREKERRTLPLVERLRLSELDRLSEIAEARRNAQVGESAPPIANPPMEPKTNKPSPKLIPVSVWAEEMFGDYAPARNTLLSWIKNGKITPAPIKVGRRYFCKPDARYFDAFTEKIRRMTGGY